MEQEVPHDLPTEVGRLSTSGATPTPPSRACLSRTVRREVGSCWFCLIMILVTIDRDAIAGVAIGQQLGNAKANCGRFRGKTSRHTCAIRTSAARFCQKSHSTTQFAVEVLRVSKNSSAVPEGCDSLFEKRSEMPYSRRLTRHQGATFHNAGSAR